jgi:hypothetical protein
MSETSVLLIGLEPSLIDFSDVAYSSYPGLNAENVRAGLEADAAHLNALGYDVELCLTDFGETAETVVKERLQQKRFDGILIGAGIRLIAQNTALLEKLVNVAHEHARCAKFCFNTKPTDTADAVQRVFPHK